MLRHDVQHIRVVLRYANDISTIGYTGIFSFHEKCARFLHVRQLADLNYEMANAKFIGGRDPAQRSFMMLFPERVPSMHRTCGRLTRVDRSEAARSDGLWKLEKIWCPSSILAVTIHGEINHHILMLGSGLLSAITAAAYEEALRAIGYRFLAELFSEANKRKHNVTGGWFRPR